MVALVALRVLIRQQTVEPRCHGFMTLGRDLFARFADFSHTGDQLDLVDQAEPVGAPGFLGCMMDVDSFESIYPF